MKKGTDRLLPFFIPCSQRVLSRNLKLKNQLLKELGSNLRLPPRILLSRQSFHRCLHKLGEVYVRDWRRSWGQSTQPPRRNYGQR